MINWDRLKKSVKRTASSIATGTKKTIKLGIAAHDKNKEIGDIKKSILLNLSVNELKKLAYLCHLKDIEYDVVTGKKRKLTRVDYIDEISSKVRTDKLIYYLKSMNKSRLAAELENKVYLTKQHYETKKQVIKEGKKKTKSDASALLKSLIKIVIDSIISFNPDKEYKKESLYQTELLGYLKGQLPDKLGRGKVRLIIGKESKLPKCRRIDLLLNISGYKIGIETKFDLSSAGKVQRLMGQMIEYSEHIDALVIAQYSPIEKGEARDSIKKMREKINIPIKIIAAGVKI